MESDIRFIRWLAANMPGGRPLKRTLTTTFIHGGKRQRMSSVRRYRARSQFDTGRAIRLDAPIGSYRTGLCKIIRSVTSTATIGSGTNSGMGFSFSLSVLPSVTDFNSLFDMYRIVGVRVLVNPRFNSAEIGGAADQSWPVCLLWYDEDDSTAPTNINSGLVRSNARRLDLTRSTEFWITPKVAVGVSGPSSGFTVLRKPLWINMSQTDVTHNGLKLAWQSGGTAGTNNYIDFTFHYYIQLKYGQ